jgi:hypothetical protein
MFRSRSAPSPPGPVVIDLLVLGDVECAAGEAVCRPTAEPVPTGASRIVAPASLDETLGTTSPATGNSVVVPPSPGDPRYLPNPPVATPTAVDRNCLPALPQCPPAAYAPALSAPRSAEIARHWTRLCGRGDGGVQRELDGGVSMDVGHRRAAVDRTSTGTPVLLRSEPVSTPDVRGTGDGSDRATAPFFTGGAVGDAGGGDGTRRAPGPAPVHETAAPRPADCQTAVGCPGDSSSGPRAPTPPGDQRIGGQGVVPQRPRPPPSTGPRNSTALPAERP